MIDDTNVSDGGGGAENAATKAIEWPADRARSWLLRKAAGLVGGEHDPAASAFAHDASVKKADRMCEREEWFRTLLSENILAFCSEEEIEAAVAEVYEAVVLATEERASGAAIFRRANGIESRRCT